MNYLKGTGYPLGLLVNFGHFPGIEHERIVSTTSTRISKTNGDEISVGQNI